jgi:hypothetical protein
MWRTHESWHALSGAGDAEREVQDARRRQHRATHGRRAAADRAGPHGARRAYSTEMRALRRLMRLLDEEQRRVLELVK